MDYVIALYLFGTCILILAMALYVNFPHRFKVIYFKMSKLSKVLFTLALSAVMFTNVGLPMAMFFFVIILFTLLKTERFAYIYWRG
jgi:hypothetical protein